MSAFVGALSGPGLLPLHQRRPAVVGHLDAPAAVQLPQKPHLQGVPRGRPLGPHRGAAALPGHSRG